MIENYLVILADPLKSVGEKLAALDEISEILDKLKNKEDNRLQMKEKFLSLSNLYKELSEKSDELQEKLISILSSRFVSCKYDLKAECMRLIHHNGLHDIEINVKSSITQFASNRKSIPFYGLLQNFLTLIQWSHGFDYKKTIELLDYIVEHACDEYFSGLKNFVEGGFGELYKSLHLYELKDSLDRLKLHCVKSIEKSSRYEEIRSYITGIIRSHPSEDRIILNYENKEPYRVWRRDQFGREGFFFRIPITRKEIIRNCIGHITYFNFERNHKASNIILHWAEVPEHYNYRPIIINPGESFDLDFLIKYEKEETPRLYVQTLQPLFFDHYYFYIKVTSEGPSGEIWLEMLRDPGNNSIEVKMTSPPVTDIMEIFSSERNITPGQSSAGDYERKPQPSTMTQVEAPSTLTGVYEHPLFLNKLSPKAPTSDNNIIPEYSDLLKESWTEVKNMYQPYQNLKLDPHICKILKILMDYKRTTEKAEHWQMTSRFKKEKEFQKDLFAYFIREGNYPNSTFQHDVVTKGESDLLVKNHLVELKLFNKKIDFNEKIDEYKAQIKQLTIDREKDIGFLVIMDNSPQKEEGTQNKKNEIKPILIRGGRNTQAENDSNPIGLICLLINGGIPSQRSRILQ